MRDATTGAPVTAQLRTPGFAWNYGEFVTTRASTGRFHLWLPTGTHTVVVTAEVCCLLLIAGPSAWRGSHV